MGELILLPQSQTIWGHSHQQDYSGRTNNCMVPEMPVQSSHTIDPLFEIGKMVEHFGEKFHRTYLVNPKHAFWSLDEIRDWARDNCQASLYAMLTSETSFCFGSTDEQAIFQLTKYNNLRKNYFVECEVDALLTPRLKAWIGENIVGRRDISIGPINNGVQTLLISFKEETDETLFRVRWMGQAEMTIAK